ncbi:MAG: FecR domain-containing protein [Gemmatimonadaceae bacterium]|jgi:transmembrane sensor
MSSTWSPTDELLARFLRADCTSEEAHSVQGWLAQSAGNARRLEGVRHLLAPSTGAAWDVDRMWAVARARTIDADRTAVVRQAPQHQAPHVGFDLHPWRSRIAASLLFALVGTAAWLEWRPRPPEPTPVAPDIVYQARRGQTATVQLSDGSKVRLAPESRLAVAAGFGEGARELTLEGEAEFDVHHDASRPFRVRTATTVTEDIGTRFGLRAYGNEVNVTVAVAEGAVALGRRETGSRGRPEGVLLRAGELGVLDATGAVSTARGAAVARALAWTRNELVFDKQPMRDVLATISRWYDLEIHVADPRVAATSVTAEFSTQSADEMLQALAIAVDAVVERNGRRVTLRSR